MGSIFVQKEALNDAVATGQKDGSTALIMPTFWAPPDATMDGVVDLADKDDADKKKRIEEYKMYLNWQLESSVEDIQ